MILIVCAVHDSAINAFGRPFFVNAKGQALRSFRDEVLRVDPANDLNKHPSDFTLYALGEFDDSVGRFHSETGPELLIRGKDVKALSEE